MYLLPKIFSYAINAYLDAQIAEELTTYIRTKGTSFATHATTAQQRAEKLVMTSESIPGEKKLSYLIGLAYTQYYVNGLADILYANLLWAGINPLQKSSLERIYTTSITHFRKNLTTSYQFEEIIHRPDSYVWYWPFIVIHPWGWIDAFAKKRCNYHEPLDKNALKKASLEVQHQNSQDNLQIARLLRGNTRSLDQKVIALRAIANNFSDPTSFLSHCATTQEAAARWDTVYIRLMNRSFK